MSMSLFEDVPVDDVAGALAGLERRRFAAGSTVLSEGDYSGELYLVESGAADVFVADRDGTEHHVARVGPRTTLGEMSLFTGRPASGTVRARTDLQVVVVTARALEHLGDRLPRVYRNIGAILAERLAASNRLSVGDRPGRITVLIDRGAPPTRDRQADGVQAARGFCPVRGYGATTVLVRVSSPSESYRDGEPAFYSLVVWHDQAEHAAASLSKGSRVVSWAGCRSGPGRPTTGRLAR
jgi:CRP-like cAMP-binding protein